MDNKNMVIFYRSNKKKYKTYDYCKIFHESKI